MEWVNIRYDLDYVISHFGRKLAGKKIIYRSLQDDGDIAGIWRFELLFTLKLDWPIVYVYLGIKHSQRWRLTMKFDLWKVLCLSDNKVLIYTHRKFKLPDDGEPTLIIHLNTLLWPRNKPGSLQWMSGNLSITLCYVVHKSKCRLITIK